MNYEDDEPLEDALTIDVVESISDLPQMSKAKTDQKNSCKKSRRKIRCDSDDESCENVSFRLESNFRQITLFTNKSKYKIGEKGIIILFIFSNALSCYIYKN